ncbi:Lrp/AsnC family transcriptional regulator [Heyndrickxia coagulans]|uniref:Lrp/AsnC family transcriptional regulator n=1 Tax=Heyndrickxia coagulans TaxID=1398 RepID=UPI0022369140|nr:Lrp/AsnC family transcriptional regulator [Heyndrickxia coagulans]UZH06074.1 Lrp/AsnC family transcriptional regulator [Heyndrickxia coagulans]
MEYKIDDLDRGIIQLLSRDGRIAFKEIAGRLNVTEKTVHLRYKNLIENGIMEVVGVVNPISIGLKTGAIIQVKVASQSLQTVVEKLSRMSAIRFITLLTGEYPLLVQITAKNGNEITDTVLALNEIPEISGINTMVQLKVYKNTFQYI